MTSKIERVNCSSLFFFFFHAGEILIERSLVKSWLHNPAIPVKIVSIVF